MYLERVPSTEIARRLGCPVRLVQEDAHDLRKAGVDLPKQMARTKKRECRFPALDEIVSLTRQGKSPSEIAAIRGVKASSVERLIGRARFAGFLPKSGRQVLDGLPGGSGNARYRNARKLGLNRKDAIAYAIDPDALRPVPAMKAGRKTKAEKVAVALNPVPRASRPRRVVERMKPAIEATRSLGGKRPCMGICGRSFHSPDKSRIRICAECKSSAVYSLPGGW